jgi:hypothetical protein
MKLGVIACDLAGYTQKPKRRVFGEEIVAPNYQRKQSSRVLRYLVLQIAGNATSHVKSLSCALSSCHSFLTPQMLDSAIFSSLVAARFQRAGGGLVENRPDHE